MKILCATSLDNGARGDDYNWCFEGEIVTFGFICDRDRRDPDNGCGCSRGFSGLASHRATTTALVRDTALSEDDVRLAVESSLSDGGWLRSLSPREADRMIDETVDVMLDVAEYYNEGTIIGTSFDCTYVRRHSTTSV
ncbi:hypothetical protein QCD70_00445 [Agreia sp. PsM10]|uniref:DUF7715 family protein n=1 Tax=Agreia sp. PsM10 TaxID=3030533 RepID=UPI00263A9E3C|nr:hypothetical protein [Agreia sp. PsM10]MDN4638702.1 hypothetical protein [Agreia sp. PsM10]